MMLFFVDLDKVCFTDQISNLTSGLNFNIR